MHTGLPMHTQFNGKGKENKIIMRNSKKRPQSAIFRKSHSFGCIIIKTYIIYNGPTLTVCIIKIIISSIKKKKK